MDRLWGEDEVRSGGGGLEVDGLEEGTKGVAAGGTELRCTMSALPRGVASSVASSMASGPFLRTPGLLLP